VKIRWSPEAADDVEEIIRYIRLDSPSAARRVARTIFDGILSLRKLPNRGRIGQIKGSRELIL